MKIGTICEIVSALVPKNNGQLVTVVGDAGIRRLTGFGETQCYFIDREIETTNGKRRNWGTERQLRPVLPPPNIVDEFEDVAMSA